MSALAEVQEAFRTLPERYLGVERGLDATYPIRVGDSGHTWEVRCTPHGARVRAGVTGRDADVVIGTDADTWLRLRRGELSGVEAFSRRQLYARGDLAPAAGGPPRRSCASTTSCWSTARGSRRSPWATAPTCSCCTAWGPRRRHSSTPPRRSAAPTARTRSTFPASAARASPRSPAAARRSAGAGRSG